MKQLFFVIFILSTSIMLADWPVTEETGPYQYRDVSDYDYRNLMDIGFCDCPCDSVIKSVKVYTDQEDDEIFLSAGYIIQGKHCQRIEIVVNACYQQTLSSIDLNFDNSNPNDDCMDEIFNIYRSTGGYNPETAAYCSNFQPFSGDATGQLLLVPPVNACSSATFTFYICSDYIDEKCEHDDIPAVLSVGDCDIDMMFHMDFYTGMPPVLRFEGIGKKDDNLKKIEHKKSYRIFNIFNMIEIEGTYTSDFELSELIQKAGRQYGLFIIQVFEDDRMIKQGKFINY